jgi:hypothetical protein
MNNAEKSLHSIQLNIKDKDFFKRTRFDSSAMQYVLESLSAIDNLDDNNFILEGKIADNKTGKVLLVVTNAMGKKSYTFIDKQYWQYVH